MSEKRAAFPPLIYIVEDNVLYARVLQEYLRQNFNGAQVQIFATGEPVMDYLSNNPDFIILDYFLDSKNYNAANGLVIVKKIKSKNPLQNLLVLSGLQSTNIALEVKDAGGFYIVKNADAFTNVVAHIQSTFLVTDTKTQPQQNNTV